MTLEDCTIITIPRQKESSEPTTEEKLSFLNFIQSCEIADKMVHFSCDDTYACLYDLILNDTIRGPEPGLLILMDLLFYGQDNTAIGLNNHLCASFLVDLKVCLDRVAVLIVFHLHVLLAGDHEAGIGAPIHQMVVAALQTDGAQIAQEDGSVVGVCGDQILRKSVIGFHLNLYRAGCIPVE